MSSAALRSTPAFASLLALAERLLRESADPEVAALVDVEAWLEEWLASPAPALGGRAPSEMLDTPDGFDTVRRLLLSHQAATYW